MPRPELPRLREPEGFCELMSLLRTAYGQSIAPSLDAAKNRAAREGRSLTDAFTDDRIALRTLGCCTPSSPDGVSMRVFEDGQLFRRR